MSTEKAARTTLSMKDMITLMDWGKNNIRYMETNPRNNIRRKIRTDTGLNIGASKIIDLMKTLGVKKKNNGHGGPRPSRMSKVMKQIETLTQSMVSLSNYVISSVKPHGMAARDGAAIERLQQEFNTVISQHAMLALMLQDIDKVSEEKKNAE